MEASTRAEDLEVREEVPVKSKRRSVALILAALLAITLQIASTGALFTPVPIPMPAYMQLANPRA